MSWGYATHTQAELVQAGYSRTTTIKRVTHGEHKGKWRLMWNPASGGVWVREE